MLESNAPDQSSTDHTAGSDFQPTRRNVLGTLGLATAAFCGSSIQSQAFGSSQGQGTTAEYPADWVKLEGRVLTEYIKYINSLKLKNISTHTVVNAHAKKRGSVWNRLPPKNWWNRMGYTLRVVDCISSAMKTPVKDIISAYRSPEYNARCAGAKRGSWHQANVAVDVRFHTSARNVTYAARKLRDRGLFKGGVGGYASFTHIDTRGENINW